MDQEQHQEALLMVWMGAYYWQVSSLHLLGDRLVALQERLRPSACDRPRCSLSIVSAVALIGRRCRSRVRIVVASIPITISMLGGFAIAPSVLIASIQVRIGLAIILAA